MTAVFDGLPEVFIDTFGELVGWRPAGAPTPTPLGGIVVVQPVDQAFSEPGAAIESQTLTVDIAEADAPTILPGDGFNARNLAWSVIRVDRDGRGMFRLSLHREAI